LITAAPEEGARSLAVELASHLSRAHAYAVLGPRDQLGSHLRILNRRILGLRALVWLSVIRPRRVIYMPQSGLTRASILRILLLRFFTLGAHLELVVVQFHASGMTPFVLRLLSRLARQVVVATEDQKAALIEHGISSHIVGVRVSATKLSTMTREDARRAVGWDANEKVFLHVGHARLGRGLEHLGPLAQSGRLVLVLSTTFEAEPGTVPAGRNVEVHRGHVENLRDFYRAADVYVFPTRSTKSVIGLPMSIVEARANGTPVAAIRSDATKRFATDPGVVICDEIDELLHAATALTSGSCAVGGEYADPLPCRGDFIDCSGEANRA